MTTWPRRFAALALGAVLSVVVACSAADDSVGPTPTPTPTELQASTTLLSALRDLHLLTCSAQPYAAIATPISTTAQSEPQAAFAPAASLNPM